MRALAVMRERFVAAIWRERLAWLCDGIDDLGRRCDAVWPAPVFDVTRWPAFRGTMAGADVDEGVVVYGFYDGLIDHVGMVVPPALTIDDVIAVSPFERRLHALVDWLT